MKVKIGQDALGRWAWMLLDDQDRLVDSGDDFYEASLALEAGMDAMKARQHERDAVR